MKTKRQIVLAGIGAGAVAAAALGAYVFAGKGGARNRKKVSVWIPQAKAEVQKELRRMNTVDRTRYLALVQAVAKRYKTMKKVDTDEAVALIRHLKGQWDIINSHLKRRNPGRKSSRTARKRK